ncbi:hypothetical protein PybrP1_001946 [[Pythium] brassicae (nom. inval.)]|nr:hypothetical protein PybrP1_001946 [[Pythium] brassicae (nom. inval.)]
MARLPFALLLACAVVITLVTDTSAATSYFQISGGAVAKVSASAKLSSNHVFAKTWQIRARANASAVEDVLVMAAGTVFISYADAPGGDSDVVAEVTFSGSSEAAVSYYIVENQITYPHHGVQINGDVRTLAPNDTSYLLTEIVVHKKRQVKRVDALGISDIVIEANVLFTATKDAVVAPAPAARAVGAALKLEKQTADTGPNVWFVRTVANATYETDVKLGVTAALAGNVSLEVGCTLWEPFSRSDSIARVRVMPNGAGTSRTGSEVNVTRGSSSDFDTLAVQVKSSNAAAAGAHVILDTLSSVHVELPDLAPNIVVEDGCLSPVDDETGLELHFRYVTRSAFIVDADAELVLTEAHFSAPASGLQVEVKALTANELALRSFRNGDIRFFATGAIKSNVITAAPNGDAKVCLASSNDLKVAFLDPRKSAQVSFPGRAGGSAFACTKTTAPKREPTPLKDSAKSAGSSSGAKSPTATSSASRSSSHVALLVAGVLTMAAAAM